MFGQLETDQKDAVFDSLKKANYNWIALSLVFGILSHISRAYRWKYLLSPLGYKPRFWNSFFSVMIGYLVNLFLPRVGEVTRCGIMSKYEKISFSKLVGTVIAERIADLTILGTIIVVVIFVELDTIKALLVSIIPQDLDTTYILTIVGVSTLILTIIAIVAYQVLKRSVNTVATKIKGILHGFADGLKSIMKMEHSFLFILHTLFIWLMYMTMFYVAFLSLPETSNVPISVMLAAFSLGALSLILVQGGIGVYPAAIMKVLLLYKIGENGDAGALGWIIWASQTAMLLSLGLLAAGLISWYNRNTTDNEDTQANTV